MLKADTKLLSKEKGTYTYPENISIAGIDCCIVDPHDDVLDAWYRVKGSPAAVLHIDNHSDMACGALVPSQIAKKCDLDKMRGEFYRKNIVRDINIGDFISVAVTDGIAGPIYHYDPRNKYICAYGRIANGEIKNVPKTRFDERYNILWETTTGKHSVPSPDIIGMKEMCGEINGSPRSLILDIDLDAFASGNDRIGEDGPSDCISRMENVRNLLNGVNRPDVITIARSQTPMTWCPPEKVDWLQMETMRILEQLYSNKKNS